MKFKLSYMATMAEAVLGEKKEQHLIKKNVEYHGRMDSIKCQQSLDITVIHSMKRLKVKEVTIGQRSKADLKIHYELLHRLTPWNSPHSPLT